MEEEMIGIGEGNKHFADNLRNAFFDPNSSFAGNVGVYSLSCLVGANPEEYTSLETAMFEGIEHALDNAPVQ